MRFDIVTIFPNILDSYKDESILGRAQKKGLININFHNLRDYTFDKHKTTDDKPFGGGPGMVMMIEPIYRAVKSLKVAGRGSRVVLLSPRGRKFNQKMAERFSHFDQLILICGRYEGVDERVIKNIAEEVVSVGDYILSGGELPAMIVTEAVSRLVAGVLGNKESLNHESYSFNLKSLSFASESLEKTTKDTQFLDFPQYSRPAIFETDDGRKWKVPEVLLSGNHKRIQEWREKHKKTKKPKNS